MNKEEIKNQFKQILEQMKSFDEKLNQINELCELSDKCIKTFISNNQPQQAKATKVKAEPVKVEPVKVEAPKAKPRGRPPKVKATPSTPPNTPRSPHSDEFTEAPKTKTQKKRAQKVEKKPVRKSKRKDSDDETLNL
jgi:hypothetical protein